MLGHDSMTVWERETKQDKDGKSRAMFVKLPKISKKSTKKNKTSNKYSALKLPNLDDDHSSPDNAEDMKKLLSMAYQQEWLAHKSAEYTQEMRNQMVLEKERRVREKRIAKRFRESLKPKKELVENKPLFKLSRFNKVKSCIDTRWSKMDTSEKSIAHV